MIAGESHFIISPNLGCPVFVAVDGENDPSAGVIRVLTAAASGESNMPTFRQSKPTISLRPSYPREGLPEMVPLEPIDPPTELTDWNTLSGFREEADTRTVLNKVLHYEVLGPRSRYWSLNMRLKPESGSLGDLLQTVDGVKRPTLYDIVAEWPETGERRINLHAVQLVETFSRDCRFIHVTDLHIAMRNDEILDEVLAGMTGEHKNDAADSYVNFNENFRRFIAQANECFERGELDFVVITGDLVDFAYVRWEAGPNDTENNWRTFANILTGTGRTEKAKGNPGLKVPAFTSTGNHDWRPRPYNPNIEGIRERFGLKARHLAHYHFQFIDKSLHGKRRAELAKQLYREQFDTFNFEAFTDKHLIKLAQWLESDLAQLLLPPLAGALGFSGARAAGLAATAPRLARFGLYSAVGLGVLGAASMFLDWMIEEKVRLILDNPLHADSMSLHYYLKHINPYLDYAFRWGPHSFIVMDTGPDVFVGTFLDGKQLRNIKRMSFVGSILGGSPDSKAFDSQRSYANWSQIVWLEKVLTAIDSCRNETEESASGTGEIPNARTTIFLHAPPVNVNVRMSYVRKKLWERSRAKTGVPWIPREEYDLTFGTINHYVSQFMYLCLGIRECELGGEPRTDGLGRVDLVFSGHTHRNIEFRVARGEHDRLRIFSDAYSDELRERAFTGDSVDRWWEERSPIMVQTAACGFSGADDRNPPYHRRVHIDAGGTIRAFDIWNTDGPVKSTPEDE